MLKRALLATLLLAACLSSSTNGGGGGGDQPAPTDLFSAAITQVTLEVDYQEGAEPYTGSAGRFSDVWQVMRDNTARLFQSHGKTITIPSTLGQMEKLTDITGTSFTSEAILAIADRHRGMRSSGATATFYIVFLDGYFQDDGGVEKDVLGVSLGSTGVIAMFKPVIESTETLFLGVAKYVEQSTLVHEFGHAIGLVNNGLAMVAAHQDSAHGAHCANEKCTMYWQNEGASAAVTFARNMLMTGSDVIFGSECLADVDAAH